MGEETYGPRTPAWSALSKYATVFSQRTIASLFQEDADRAEAFSAEAEGVWLDLSRQRLDSSALELLLELAKQTEVAVWIKRMFDGEHINNTEDRAALHVALRRPADCPLTVDGEDVMRLVKAERAKMQQLADALHEGELKGYTGHPITDIVNIGIGGSDLGLVMAVEALSDYRKPGLGVHFVSNLDGVQVSRVLEKVSPETTLFVVCSKSFTTLETLTNAQVVREWLLACGGEQAVATQFVAVSTDHAAMDAFGIAPKRRLALWDWVGGRYSLCSPVGLSLALAVGWEHFEALLRGAHAMDCHFEQAPSENNLPVLLALTGVWNRNFLGMPSHAVLPYDHHLCQLPAYLQQLEMESNGKRVTSEGEPIDYPTAPITWGGVGTDGQHAVFQLLHQGTHIVPVEFLAVIEPGDVLDPNHHRQLLLNAFAQGAALMKGRENDDPARAYPGNRPSSTLLLDTLDPRTMGALIAFYEHRTFVNGVLLGINSFDQWGVELGKEMSHRILPELTSVDTASGHDSSTNGLINHLKRLREEDG